MAQFLDVLDFGHLYKMSNLVTLTLGILDDLHQALETLHEVLAVTHRSLQLGLLTWLHVEPLLSTVNSNLVSKHQPS